MRLMGQYCDYELMFHFYGSILCLTIKIMIMIKIVFCELMFRLITVLMGLRDQVNITFSLFPREKLIKNSASLLLESRFRSVLFLQYMSQFLSQTYYSFIKLFFIYHVLLVFLLHRIVMISQLWLYGPVSAIVCTYKW